MIEENPRLPNPFAHLRGDLLKRRPSRSADPKLHSLVTILVRQIDAKARGQDNPVLDLFMKRTMAELAAASH
jgi:hypothetical protein